MKFQNEIAHSLYDICEKLSGAGATNTEYDVLMTILKNFFSQSLHDDISLWTDEYINLNGESYYKFKDTPALPDFRKKIAEMIQ